MKKTRSKYLRSFLFLLLAAAACLVFFHYNNRVILYNVPGDVAEIGAHPANNRQYRATVWMGVHANELYFYTRTELLVNRTKYGGKLCIFKDETACNISRLSYDTNNVRIMGQSGKYLY